MILLFDLGQPLRFWHPVVYWQPHSLLWEITMCVVLYLSVLLAELLPIILEHELFHSHPLLDKSKFLRGFANFLQKLSGWLHKAGPVLAVIGLTLSLLHQASLGATYGVLSGRGLWFSQTAPVIFVLSAVAGGTCLLFVTSIMVFRVMRPGLVKDDVLLDIARFAGYVALLCIYIRIWDWAVTNYYSFDLEVALQTDLLNTVSPYTSTFWIGQILFAVDSWLCAGERQTDQEDQSTGFLRPSADRLHRSDPLELQPLRPDCPDHIRPLHPHRDPE